MVPRIWDRLTALFRKTLKVRLYTREFGGLGGYNLLLNEKHFLNSSLSVEGNSSSPLIIQNELIAQLTALEWSLSPFLKKDFATSRPLTSLLFRAAFLQSQHNIIDEFKKILAFLPSDTVLYWDGQEHHNLHKEQEVLWSSEIKKFNSRFGLCILPSFGTLATSPSFALQSGLRDMIASISGYVSSRLSSESVAACEMVIRDFKSCILGLNLAFGDSTVEEVVDAATLETRMQTQKWGSLEDCHELDTSRLMSRAQLASLVFKYCK